MAILRDNTVVYDDLTIDGDLYIGGRKVTLVTFSSGGKIIKKLVLV